eukprot:TRINITY_DN5491_c0_g1_i2.p1 TRINITY_DN5491_c0_g1~~TRINITY_DN5491_c0_g1_i2.p1  ORF type:complete len:992 (+),score=262.93 TRINITY_DN5491_c0_g1_i2:225-3200(+)
MMKVDDEDHHLVDGLADMTKQLETLTRKSLALDPKIDAVTKNLSNLSQDLEFDRRSVILSMKRRGYAYSLDRSRGAQNRRTHKEFVAKFYFVERNFVDTLSLVEIVTDRVRSVLGNLSSMVKGHRALLYHLDRSDEMGGSLLVGQLLEDHLMPLLMEYRRYARGFEDGLSTLRTLSRDPDVAAALEMYRTDKWGGIDLESILWLPFDHIHRTASVVAEMVQVNQQELQHRAVEESLGFHHSTQHQNSIQDVQANLGRLQRVYGAVVATCDTVSATPVIARTLESVRTLQDELCGDFSNFVIPGRRELYQGKLNKILLAGQTVEVNAYLFHDVLLTATDGASGFRVFSSKTNLYNASVVHAVSETRFKIVERDQVSGLVVGTHTFDAETAAAAAAWSARIRTAATVMTRSWRSESCDESNPNGQISAVLRRQAEDLANMSVSLTREVKMLKEEEQSFEDKLDVTLSEFGDLRAQQWDIDCDRISVGLSVDERTRAEMLPAETTQQGQAVMTVLVEDTHDQGDADQDRKQSQVTAVGLILDSLLDKLGALEDVLTGFAFQPLKPDQSTIPLDQVPGLLAGEWRMFCQREGEEFSYGLIIQNVRQDHADETKFHWSGTSKVPNRYSCQDAVALWDPDKGTVQLNFTEVWHESDSRDELVARLKLNGKFSCESSGGYKQKARKETTMPTSAAERSVAPFAKYYMADCNADQEADHLASSKKRDQLLIPFDLIPGILEGEWRMYCSREGQVPFSYGLLIQDVVCDEQDEYKFHWSGTSRVPGRYSCQDAVALWDPDKGTVQLNFTEVWHESDSRDELVARLKLNGKFSCESSGGYKQKARKETTMPTSAAERAKVPYGKYYAGDPDAMVEDDLDFTLAGVTQVPVVEHDADDTFWQVVSKVRRSLGGIEHKMQQLDHDFWNCRRISDRNFFGGLDSSQLKEKFEETEKKLAEERRTYASKKQEFRTLERMRDHALSALQIAKKKVMQASCDARTNA